MPAILNNSLAFVVTSFLVLAAAPGHCLQDLTDSAVDTAAEVSTINNNFRELDAKKQGKSRIKVGTFTSSSSTGNQSITGVGFKPRLIILGGDTGDASTARFSLGWGTVDDQAAVLGGAWADDTDTLGGLTTIDTAVFKRVDDSGNATALATVTSFDTDGFTLNWSVAQSITISYLAFE